jgi:hypothetical protein
MKSMGGRSRDRESLIACTSWSMPERVRRRPTSADRAIGLPYWIRTRAAARIPSSFSGVTVEAESKAVHIFYFVRRIK